MIDRPWWEQWEHRLQYEQDALDAAGIGWSIDEGARSRGVLRMTLSIPHGDDNLEGTVLFSDSFPYFRFQLYVPGLNLAHHQNPFEHTLCLLGRRTFCWNTTDTVAAVLKSQLPSVIAAGRETNRDAVIGVEQAQAEPFSDYYRYADSMFLVQSDWVIPPEHRSGSLLIGTAVPEFVRPDMELRGAVLEVRAKDGSVLCAANDPLRRAFAGRKVNAKWARVSAPIRQDNPEKFLHELSVLHPGLGYPTPVQLRDESWLSIWAVIFPEEISHRTMGEGWVFVCTCDRRRPKVRRVYQQMPAPKFLTRPGNKHGKRR